MVAQLGTDVEQVQPTHAEILHIRSGFRVLSSQVKICDVLAEGSNQCRHSL